MKARQFSQFLWSIVLIVTLQFRQAHGCTANIAGVGSIPNVVQGKVVRCTLPSQCEGASILGCDAVFCLNKLACKGALISVTTYVECNFYETEAACSGTIISSANSCLNCVGNSCNDVTFGTTRPMGTGYHGTVCNTAPSSSPSTTPSESPSKTPVAQTVPVLSIIDKKLCFSAWNTVEVKGKGVLAMDSVQIGDLVRANDSKSRDSFSRVISIMHVDRDAEVEYIQIYTERFDAPLEISPDHYMYSDMSNNKKRNVVRARDVHVGDTLGTNKVTQIQSIKRRGLYAPVTESGQIVVSGILASCYVGMFDDVPSSIQAVGSHFALAPLRVACLVDFSICKNELYSNDGFSMNLLRMIDLGLLLSDVSVAMQLSLLVLCFPLLGALVMLKILISHGIVVSSGVVVLSLWQMNAYQKNRY